MDNARIHWLAGLLEGEGSFMRGPPSAPNKPRIQLEMTDEDVVRRVADMWGVSYWGCKRESRWKRSYKCQLRGGKAIGWMKQLQPMMSTRRREQIQRALDSVDWTKRNQTRKMNLPSAEIRALYAQGGITHRALAERFGCSHRTIWAIVNGKRN